MHKTLLIEIIHKEKPDLTKFPQIIPLKEFDAVKHAKICKNAEVTVPPEGIQELNEVPNFLQNLPPPETFEQLLDRIKRKVVGPAADVQSSPDLDNVNIDEFIGRMQKKIRPVSEPPIPTSSRTPLPQTRSSATNPRKSKVSQAEAVTEEMPAPKRGRGRPPNNPKI
uniref:Uncharacterized protein n=1 Tax=Panagrolaimus davidi TaxID=227884 RepID=A0A914QXQ8_9BILA